jgi:hypothetical protein
MVCPCEDDNGLLGSKEGRLASEKELCSRELDAQKDEPVQNKVHREICSYIICGTVILLLVLFNSYTCSKRANHDTGL